MLYLNKKFCVKAEGNELKVYRNEQYYNIRRIIRGDIFVTPFIAGLLYAAVNIFEDSFLIISSYIAATVIILTMIAVTISDIDYSLCYKDKKDVSGYKDESNTTISNIVVPLVMNIEPDEDGYRWLNSKDSRYLNSIVKKEEKRKQAEKVKDLKIKAKEEKLKDEEEKQRALEIEQSKKKKELNISETSFNNIVNDYMDNSEIKIQ